jgi:hypothetical protein
MRRIERDGGFFFLCVKKIHFHHMSMCVCLRSIYIFVCGGVGSHLELKKRGRGFMGFRCANTRQPHHFSLRAYSRPVCRNCVVDE